MDKGEPFCIVGGNADWCSHCESTIEIPQNIKNGTGDIPNSGDISEGTQNTNLKEGKHLMFIAASCTITKIWKQPKCPSVDEWMKQLWDMYTMKYYSAIIKKKIILLFATAWMDLEKIMLSEISQVVKEKYHMISPLTGT